MRDKIDSRIYAIQDHKGFAVTIGLYDIIAEAGAVAGAAEAAGYVIAEAGPEADPIALAWWIVAGLLILASLILVLLIYFVVVAIKAVIEGAPLGVGVIGKAFNPLLQFIERLARTLGDDLVDAALAFGATIERLVHGLAGMFGYKTYASTFTNIQHWMHPTLKHIEAMDHTLTNLWAGLYGGLNYQGHHVQGVGTKLTVIFTDINGLKHRVTKLEHTVDNKSSLPQWVRDAIHTLQNEYGKLNTEVYRTITTRLNHLQSEIDNGAGKVDAKIAHEITTLQHQLQSIDYEVKHNVEHAISVIEHELGPIHGNVVAHILQDINQIKHQQSVEAHEYQTIQDRLTKIETRLYKLEHTKTIDGSKVWHSIDTLQSEANTFRKLLPFTALLPLTQEAISNLNKLKENPCQCRSRAGADNDDAIWTAIAENIIANGF